MDWYRVYHGAPTDPKWRLIASRVTQCNAPSVTATPACVAAVFWSLMDYASQQKDRGSITGFDTETLASAFDWSETKVLAILEGMKLKNVISNNRLTAWDKRQPKREDDSKERVQRYRERQREEEPKRDVTQRNGSVTPDREIDKKERKKESLPPTPLTGGDAEFNEFWKQYPEKVGKPTARQKFTIALRKATFAEIMAGLQRYRDTKPPDRAWCHPSTWLHQERWNDKPAPNNGKQPANGNGHANGHSVIGFARGTREWWESVREMRGYYFAPGEREKFEKQFGGAT